MEDNELIKSIVNNVEKVIIGKTDEIYNVLKGIIADGHILIEDVPGVGKTMLVKAIARSFHLTYSRIQFTPDLLPSDITGVSIYNPSTTNFEFRKGPVFSNILLADEINRTSPKTQSALLEVMEERQVSEGNNTYLLEKPFFVLATQNPIEYEGTFNLPEAQLDRFMIKVKIGYPDERYECDILERYRNDDPIEKISAIAEKDDIIKLQKKVRNVSVNEKINDYIVRIVNETRKNPCLLLGASTRASLALLRISQSSAVINGRDYVIPDDVKNNAALVLSHRICLSPLGRANGYTGEQIINRTISQVAVPAI